MANMLGLVVATGVVASSTAFAAPSNDGNGAAPAFAATSPSPLISTDDVEVKFGGRIQTDFTWASGDAPYDSDDGVEFRRARIFMSGTLYELVDFKAQYDFTGGDTDFKDVWMGMKDSPVAGTDIKVGHFKEPFSLEELTSSKYITFLERALPNAFAPGRNTGVQFSDGSDSFGWALGVFRDADDFGNDNPGDEPDSETDSEYAFTARVAGTPVHGDGKLLHVDVGVSHRSADDGSERFRARPEAHLLNRVADTGAIAADGTMLYNAGIAWVQGPASLQGEYTMATVDPLAGGDLDFSGFYVQGSLFLTGESRAYKSSSASFSRTKPSENYTRDGGSGAWEVAVRYSTLDLNDGASDDELDNVTLALNWYANPYTRVMLNYVHSSFEDTTADEDANLLLLRFQIDW